ncbi:MAG: hypothetical protein AAB676_17125 [Verrucomicrobiota bacterium]
MKSSEAWSHGKGFEEPRLVLVIAKDVLPAIPTGHGVVNRTGKLDSKRVRHEANRARSADSWPYC